MILVFSVCVDHQKKSHKSSVESVYESKKVRRCIFGKESSRGKI